MVKPSSYCVNLFHNVSSDQTLPINQEQNLSPCFNVCWHCLNNRGQQIHSHVHHDFFWPKFFDDAGSIALQMFW